MSSITPSTGLVTGMDIQGTVDQLIALAGVPRDNLVARTDILKTEQLAVTELSAYLYAFQSLVVNLGKEALYDGRTAASSNDTSMTASVTNQEIAAVGNYTFTTLRTAQSEQWLSTGVADDEAALGGGEFSFRFGDNLQRNLPLETLNGGDGIERGVIRITDRSGAWANIDLTSVQTLDGVVEAISSNLDINVTAELHGDGIRLTDDSGQTVVNLLVQEVSGLTAASLGLDGINVAANSVQGEDLVSLFDEIDLTQLNDGNGVRMGWDVSLGDIEYTLADGTTGVIDFTPPNSSNGFEDPPATLGELVDYFNEEAPSKLQMEVSGDGLRLIVTDLTVGAETFSLSSKSGTMSHALEDLGISGEAVGGVITGRRLLGGTGSALVSTLNGGSTESLGTIDITDRTGTTVSVDLSAAETVEEVLETIEASGLAITAELNSAKNGIQLLDTSGVTVSNFIVASTDATDTAALLGITADTADTTISSGDLHQQIISYDTKLDDLNGGAGIARGDFTVVDSQGKRTVFHLADPLIETVGDLMQASMEGEAKISFDINPNGDGLLIKDVANGDFEMRVLDNSRGTAADLQLTGGLELMELDGTPTWVINGSMTHVVELEADDSLQDLTTKINAFAGGATASIFSDGSTRPYRMILGSEASGRPGAMVIDSSSLGIDFNNTIKARNAVISLGAATSGVLLSSTSNSFTEVIDGVTLQANQASADPTTISINRSTVDLVATVKVMVENYNKYRDRYTQLTAFNDETKEGEVLFGDATTRRMGSDLGWALADRYVGVGSIQTIRELGVTISASDGTLSFDENVLTAKFAEDPAAVKEFFTADPTEEDDGGPITVADLEDNPVIGAKGFATSLIDKLESLIGVDVSLVARRYKSLESKITSNETHIEFLNDRLDAQRETMLWKFYYMELAISKIQSNMTAIDSIQAISLDGTSDS